MVVLLLVPFSSLSSPGKNMVTLFSLTFVLLSGFSSFTPRVYEIFT